MSFILFFNLTGNAFAAVQDLTALQEMVREFAANTLDNNPEIKTEIIVGKLDPRLRLAKCDSSLEISQYNKARFGNQMSVSVSCPSNTRWSIYVPVTIKQIAKVLTVARSIRKGQMIDQGDLQWKEYELGRLPGGYFMNSQDVVGMVAQRNIRNGMVIASRHLRPPFAVKKGEQVVIKAAIGGVEVKMSGTAQGDGARGDIINVTNSSSNKTVEAQVIRPGVVQVRL